MAVHLATGFMQRSTKAFWKLLKIDSYGTSAAGVFGTSYLTANAPLFGSLMKKNDTIATAREDHPKTVKPDLQPNFWIKTTVNGRMPAPTDLAVNNMALIVVLIYGGK